MPDVKHSDAAHAFTADVEGGAATLEYQREGDRILFTHTFVPEPARGQDVGTTLVEAGLEFAQENDLTVVPQCPFVASYIESHPGTQNLL